MSDAGSGIAIIFLCFGMLAIASFISAIRDSGQTGEKTDFQYCWESKEKDKCFEQLIKIEGK